MAYGFSVFWLPLSHAVGGGKPRRLPRRIRHSRRAVHHQLRLARRRSELGVHPVHRLPGRRRRAVGRLAGAGGPRKAGVVAAICWSRRPAARRRRHLPAPALDSLAGHRRAGRHRPGAGLHFAGVDLDKMVPRPARHGNRHGDHGLRRRRHDRRPAGADADGPFPHADLGRRMADLRRPGRDLLRLHDGRRVRLSRAAGGLAAGRLDAAGAERQGDDHPWPGASARCAQDAGSSGASGWCCA